MVLNFNEIFSSELKYITTAKLLNLSYPCFIIGISVYIYIYIYLKNIYCVQIKVFFLPYASLS